MNTDVVLIRIELRDPNKKLLSVYERPSTLEMFNGRSLPLIFAHAADGNEVTITLKPLRSSPVPAHKSAGS